MNYKYIYMKILGFFTAIVGFSYSLTTCYNFFELVFDSKSIINTSNIIIMGLGIIYPIFVFVFGVFYYFYADVSLKNNVINSLIVINVIMNLLFLGGRWLNLEFIKSVFELIHYSFGYVLLLLNMFFIYGKYKHNY